MRVHASSAVAFKPSFQRKLSLSSRALQSTRNRDNNVSHVCKLRRFAATRHLTNQATKAAKINTCSKIRIMDYPQAAFLATSRKWTTKFTTDNCLNLSLNNSVALCKQKITKSTAFGHSIVYWTKVTYQAFCNIILIIQLRRFPGKLLSRKAIRPEFAAPETVSRKLRICGVNSWRTASCCAKLTAQYISEQK